MALKDFLYRCPFCGHDPLDGQGLVATCPGCARRFTPGSERTTFLVTAFDRDPIELSGAALARRIEALDGPLGRARRSDGAVTYSSEVTARFSGREAPLRHGGEVLGFVEEVSKPVRGTLTLELEALRFEAVRADAARRWALTELRAVQASSSSVQVSPREGGVVTFRFRNESAHRWEELIKWALRRAWAGAGRGAIVEFQPRIRTR